MGSIVLAFGLPLVDVPSPFRTVAASSATGQTLGGVQMPAGGIDWLQVVVGFYLLGTGLVLVRLGWRLSRLARLSNREPVVLSDGPRVVYLEDDGAPFSFFRTIFVPRPSEADDEALAQVVAHERTHIRQGHSIDVVLVHLAGVFQWFNPVVWGYRRALTDLHEFLADREVLSQGHDRSAYARLLLAQQFGAGPLALAHQFHHSQIRRRLDMMTRHSGRWTTAKYLLILPALTLLVAAYGEPRVVVVDDQVGPDMLATAWTAEPSASEDQADSQKTPAPTEKKVVEKKITKAELNAKLKALEEKYNATSDPTLKKEIELKMKQLRESVPPAPVTVNLNDPAAVEEMIVKVSQKIETLEAKRASTTDAEVLAKIDQDVKMLSMKRKELKAALAQLKGGQPK
ncbi:MAG: M56 family metallopeptidase [Acidobacteriota bacterium]